MESVTDTALGFAVAVVLQMFIYGEVATLLRASGLTVLVYGLAMLRRYVLRRVFAAWALRAA
jgi:multidrug transporter EmrE-like cation transporter